MTSEVLRVHDDGGRLVSAGYLWGEECELLVTAANLLFGIAACVAFLACLGLRADPKTSFVLLVPAAALVACRYWILSKRFRPRSLLFEIDGKMTAPHKVPGYVRTYREIRGHHENIRSIETIRDRVQRGERTVFTNKVAIYFANGNIVRVSDDLYPDDAHRVAVQLTTALHEIREAAAWQARSYAAGRR